MSGRKDGREEEEMPQTHLRLSSENSFSRDHFTLSDLVLSILLLQ